MMVIAANQQIDRIAVEQVEQHRIGLNLRARHKGDAVCHKETLQRQQPELTHQLTRDGGKLPQNNRV